jgi:hypothetical protein
MALVNQKTAARQGNPNPRFYQLAALQAGGGPAYFHRVTGGSNSVPGVTGFAASTSGTTPVYNQATGWGSVDGDVLINHWGDVLVGTTTSLSASAPSSTYADTVTFTASVSGSGLTGTVQFQDGGVNLGAAAALSNGSATLSTTTLATGSHTITAVYSGDGVHNGSTSGAQAFTVNPVVSAVSLALSSATSTPGQSVTLTATLGGKSVSGNLRFLDGGVPLATVFIAACPTAYSTTALSAGVHNLSVEYLGDANNTASASAVAVHTVSVPVAVTTTTLSATPSGGVAGDTVTITAQVSGQSPTGTVQFKDAGAPLGSPVAVSGGSASLATNQLGAGSHSLTAEYSGDAGNAASTSAPVVVTITAAGGGSGGGGSGDVPVLPWWGTGLLGSLLLAVMARRPRRGMASVAALTLLIPLAWLLPQTAWSAPLASWDVSTLPGGTNAFGESPLAASSSDANLTVGGLTRGSGVGTTGTAAARGWGGNTWNSTNAAAAVTANQFVTFSLTARTGYTMSISSISRFDYRRSGSGATSGVLQVQVGTSAAFTDVSNFSYTSTASAGSSLSAVDLTGLASLQAVPAGTVVTFRVVNYGASGNTGTWYLFDTAKSTASDLEVSGTVVPAGPKVDGVCGSSAGKTFATVPTTNLCSAGTPSAVNRGSSWNWTCSGTNAGATPTCSAVDSSATGC